MKLTYRTVLEIAAHEAVIRQAYKDSVGVWTWSVGITSASGHNVKRYIGKPQSIERCLEVYVWLLETKYAEDVRKAFKGCQLTEEEFAGALSFHWNTGSIHKASWVRYFKLGKMKEAERRFMQWNKPREIVGRRRAEADLIFRGKWSNDGRMTEYTRVTGRSTPVWSSAIKIDVSETIKRLLKSESPEADKPSPVVPPIKSENAQGRSLPASGKQHSVAAPRLRDRILPAVISAVVSFLKSMFQKQS